MSQSRSLELHAATILLALVFITSCGSNSGSTPTPTRTPPPTPTIKHVVIIVQENRTPDNLFHGLPHADIASTGTNSAGQTIPLSPISLTTTYDLGHQHTAFVKMFDVGKMDGADQIHCAARTGTTCPPNPQFAYVNPSEVAPYLQLAQHYTFADRMFQTNQGPSFPAHQFLISGTSEPSVGSELFASENLRGGLIAGCIATPGTTVALIDPSGSESLSQYPCFEHPTLTDELEARSLSWRYYAPSAGSIWTGPDAIQHICQAQSQNGMLVCTGAAWKNVVIPQTQVLNDIAGGQLAAVTWVIPNGQASDHPGGTNGSGPSWVASVVNAIGNSSYWKDTAIFITWDDWGGWYDHVAPPIINAYEYGFRVPLIVVSPYAKPGYVSHATHDFGSILKFIEKTFGLASLGYADDRADDLSDCFDFSQQPIVYQTVPAPFNATHFLNDTRTPTDPDDD